MGVSFVRAAVACAILEISGLERILFGAILERTSGQATSEAHLKCGVSDKQNWAGLDL